MKYNHQHIRSNLRETYNSHALDRHKRRQKPSGEKAKPLDTFLSRLKENNAKTLLDIGAGNGMDSQYFRDEGLQVTSIDLAIEHAKLCREDELSACVMDLTELGFLGNSFDAAWAVQCLFHIPIHILPKAFASIHHALKPNGLFYLSMGGGSDHEEIWEEDYFQPPRFFSFRSDETVRKMVADLFTILVFDSQAANSKGVHQQNITLQKKV